MSTIPPDVHLTGSFRHKISEDGLLPTYGGATAEYSDICLAPYTQGC